MEERKKIVFCICLVTIYSCFFKKAVDLENCGSSQCWYCQICGSTLEGKMMGWFETSTTSDSAISHSYISHVLNPKLHGSPNLKWRKRNAPLCTVRVTWTLCFVFSHALSRAFSVFLSSCPYYSVPKKKQKSTRKSTRKSTKGTCLLRLVFILYAPGLCFLCFPPPVAFVLVSWCSSQMHWRVARTLMKSGYVNCFGHFLRFSHQPSFATQQQVPRFQGSSVAVPFWFVGLAKTTRHSQTQRLKHNSHCCCESLLQQLDAARSA